jgi:hypothetical protein
MWVWFLLGWVCCHAAPLRGVELVEGPVVQVTDTTATIRWKTDVECGTRVRFGLSEDELDGRAGEGVAVTHEVTISGLKPGTAYAYSVSTAKALLKTDAFLTTKKGEPAKEPGLFSKIKEAVTGRSQSRSEPKPAPTAQGPAKFSAPPTARTWGSLRTLQDHFDRHGADFHATSPDDYARQAWEFLQRAMEEGYPAKLDDSDGTLRVWDAKTGAFAAYNRDRTTKTYFKPGSADYFARQPGRPIKLKRTE